jgi:hypothetical protein
MGTWSNEIPAHQGERGGVARLQGSHFPLRRRSSAPTAGRDRMAKAFNFEGTHAGVNTGVKLHRKSEQKWINCRGVATEAEVCAPLLPIEPGIAAH